MSMRCQTVGDLIERLSQVEDKNRRVMIAGGDCFDGVAAIGIHGRSGHVIFWDPDDLAKAEVRAGRSF